MSDIFFLILFIGSFVVSEKYNAPYAVYVVIVLMLLKYGFVDLKKYESGEKSKGALGFQLRQLEKIGGEGFALGFMRLMFVLMFIVVGIILSLYGFGLIRS